MAPKAAVRFYQPFFLFALLVILLSSTVGCAIPDWWAYNITSSPPELRVIPKEKLYLQWTKTPDHQLVQYDAALQDNEWGVAFDAVARELHGWQPDFCFMYEKRNLPSDIPFEQKFGLDPRKAFWSSYLLNVYYDAILKSPSLEKPENTSQKLSIKQLLEKEKEYLEETQRFQIIKTIDPRSPLLSKLNKIQKKIEQTVLSLEETPPSCPTQSPDSSSGSSSILSSPSVNESFSRRLLLMIDKDHDQLLVDLDPDRNSEAVKINEQIAAWWGQHKYCCRALTVSKVRPASLSQSVKHPDLEPSSEKQPFFLRAADRGQQALVSLARDLLKKSCQTPAAADCKAMNLTNLKQVLEMLENQKPSEAVLPFEEVQKLELTTSSALNSPDPMNRLEYVTTYISFHQYPYPSNGAVVLEEEFWRRVREYLVVKPKAERQRAFHAVLDAVWADMRVRIDKVETTVVQTTHEIAEVSREATQGVQMKPEPSVELKGAVRGTIDTPIDVSSIVKTAVTERLLKELDHRSTWLNSDRNVLRITERGMEAANIQGSVKEIVSLNIPKSMTNISYIDYREGTIEIRTVDQPLYSSIPAMAISLAVVREPYKFKRSVSEKFGLADSSDARYIVVVADPVWLRLWHWTRILHELDISKINVDSQPIPTPKPSAILRFYYPESGAEGVFYVGSEGKQDFIKALRKGLHDLITTKPEATKSQTTQLPFRVHCQLKDKEGHSFYLVLDLTPKTPTPTANLGNILIGLEAEDEKNRKQMIPFTGEESDFLNKIKPSSMCALPESLAAK